MTQVNFSKNVIIGNGNFPSHNIPTSILKNAKIIICCDGAANSLLEKGITPTIVIGDLDSISEQAKNVFSDKLIHNQDQNTNDQTKAIEWAIQHNLTDVVILGATGKREDHTIGNISLLAEYINTINVSIVSDSGIFYAIKSSTSFSSYIGQQISIFSLTPQCKINSLGLKYPLHKMELKSWWMGTLNESLNNEFKLNFKDGVILVFQQF